MHALDQTRPRRAKKTTSFKLAAVYQAIRTSSVNSDLRVLTGGPSGTTPFHLVVLAQSVSQPDADHQDSSFMLAGSPGNDVNHKSSGIGSVNVLNGSWIRMGGFQNPLAAGSALSRATFDTRLHVFELINDGSRLHMVRDGGRLGSVDGATTIVGPEMGFRGAYPLQNYGPPDTRIYFGGFFDRELVLAERSRLLTRYLKHEFTVAPDRYVQVTGDSIVAGHVATANTTSFIELMVSQAATGGETIYFNNQGISGQSTAQILARVTTDYMASFAPPGYREQWHIIAGRTNDQAVGLTPVQSYANHAAIVAITKAAGVKAAVMTCIPAVSMTAEDITRLADFNALVLGNSSGADAIVDLTGIMPTPATTDYLPDNVHPSDAVNAVIAAAVYAAIS